VALFPISNVISFFGGVERLTVINMEAGICRKWKLIKRNNKKLTADQVQE
jgi:hypothetical protein